MTKAVTLKEALALQDQHPRAEWSTNDEGGYTCRSLQEALQLYDLEDVDLDEVVVAYLWVPALDNSADELAEFILEEMDEGEYHRVWQHLQVMDVNSNYESVFRRPEFRKRLVSLVEDGLKETWRCLNLLCEVACTIREAVEVLEPALLEGLQGDEAKTEE